MRGHWESTDCFGNGEMNTEWKETDLWRRSGEVTDSSEWERLIFGDKLDWRRGGGEVRDSFETERRDIFGEDPEKKRRRGGR